jgi:chemotaxis receptor (MCP) glutamine deamidase CheD
MKNKGVIGTSRVNKQGLIKRELLESESLEIVSDNVTGENGRYIIYDAVKIVSYLW